MISEMGVAQLALGVAYRGRGSGQIFRSYFVLGEERVEGGLLSNQALANRNRLCLHGVEQASHGIALGIGKAELVGQLEQVARARIAVQFGGQCQSHAASGFQVGDLLVGKRLDRPSLQAGIGRLRGGGTDRQGASHEKKKRSAVHARLQWTVGNGLSMARVVIGIRQAQTAPRYRWSAYRSVSLCQT